MNFPVRSMRAAARPDEVLDVLHRYFANEVMQTASWDTAMEKDVKRKRYQLAMRALHNFLNQPIPVGGAVCGADWILGQLGSLPLYITVPSDPILFWLTLRQLAAGRANVPAEHGPC